jgi:hypothetical protein
MERVPAEETQEFHARGVHRSPSNLLAEARVTPPFGQVPQDQEQDGCGVTVRKLLDVDLGRQRRPVLTEQERLPYHSAIGAHAVQGRGQPLGLACREEGRESLPEQIDPPRPETHTPGSVDIQKSLLGVEQEEPIVHPIKAERPIELQTFLADLWHRSPPHHGRPGERSDNGKRTRNNDPAQALVQPQ